MDVDLQASGGAVDPVTAAVIRGTLETICFEMAMFVSGTATTPILYGGGGGWGDQLDRTGAAVLDDVLDEYVSVEGAARDYGVVLTGSLEELTLSVDEVRTDALRARMRAGPPPPTA